MTLLFEFLTYNNIQMLFASICVLISFLLVFWNIIFRGSLDRRLDIIYNEREQIRQREREYLKKGEKTLSKSMRSEPFYEKIVSMFNLLKRAEDETVVLKLRQAGYYGQGPVITYLAIKLLLPPAAFFVAWIYGYSILTQYLPNVAIFIIVIVFAYLSSKFPDLYLANIKTKREKEMVQFWPDTLDLMLLAIQSGMSMEMAFKTVSGEIRSQSAVVSDELLLTLAELSYLQDRGQALRNLEKRVDVEAVRSVVTALLQSERYGTSVSQALRTLAQDTRDARMTAAEKKAAALPPKLTVPMIIFFLPVLFVIIMTPAMLQIIPMMN